MDRTSGTCPCLPSALECSGVTTSHAGILQLTAALHTRVVRHQGVYEYRGSSSYYGQTVASFGANDATVVH